MGITAALLLTGCTAAIDGPFAHEQGSDDRLLVVVGTDGLRSESVRHLGDDSEGWEYYAAKDERDGARDLHCIVVVTSESDWASGCGG